jgi:CO/xanthine dehydrogenase FAD-binding subunit
VKLPDFKYRRAAGLEHAVELLAADPHEARVLAGGQSLMPVMALRLSHPGTLVDITHCEDLRTWAFHDGMLVISAAVTSRRVERSAEIARRHPLLTETLGYVGHPEIRNRGTVCGSAAHADPAAEVPALLLALEGSLRVIGADGRRRVAARDFYVGPYSTSLQPGELVAGVEIPAVPAHSGWSVKELARRHGDFALVGVICVVTVEPCTGQCSDASLTLFGVAATPRRCLSAERVLSGSVLDERVIAEAARMAFEDVEVLGDIHGSKEFRTRAGIVLVRRAIAEAFDRAQNSSTAERVTP